MTTASPREQFVGRLLALCAHPVAGWRVVSSGERGLVIGAYFAAAYVVVLAALLWWPA